MKQEKWICDMCGERICGPRWKVEAESFGYPRDTVIKDVDLCRTCMEKFAHEVKGDIRRH